MLLVKKAFVVLLSVLLYTLFLLIFIPLLPLWGFFRWVSSYKWFSNLVGFLLLPYRIYKLNSLFVRLTKAQRRDLWLYSEAQMDESKFANRYLEKFIRKKFIEPITVEYASV